MIQATQQNTAQRNDRITSFLEERIAAGDFPSAVYLIAEAGEIIFTDALGKSVADPYLIENTLDTIYDLASLTKPLVTGMLCSHLIELGEVTPDSALAHYLPEFDRTDKQMITVRELLTHCSGLPAWRPLIVLTEGDPERAVGAIADLQLEYKPRTKVVYSDLGYILLGKMLERLMGHPLQSIAKRQIIGPLKLQRTMINPSYELQSDIAASETGNAYEDRMSEDYGSSDHSKSRRRLIWGEVHDGNAFFLGGFAGHAGLFSTANETCKLAQQFLANQTRTLKPETCQLFRTNMTPGLEEARSLGWQLAATEASTAGPDLPADSFGHAGFTGTSCWIDPHSDRVFILLTNRTHARQLPFANLNSVRREFHTLASESLPKRT